MSRVHAVLVLGVVAAVVLAACGGDRRHSPPVARTPQAGVRTLEIAPATVVSTPPASLPGTTEAAAAPPPGAPGQEPVAVDSPAAGVEAAGLQPGRSAISSKPLRLFAAPDSSLPALAGYPAGAQFTVVEPDGEFPEYPVRVFDEPWYRVRAVDGLVGWIPGGSLTAR